MALQENKVRSLKLVAKAFLPIVSKYLIVSQLENLDDFKLNLSLLMLHQLKKSSAKVRKRFLKSRNAGKQISGYPQSYMCRIILMFFYLQVGITYSQLVTLL